MVSILAVIVIGSPGLTQDKPKDDTQLIQGSWDWDPAVKQSGAKPVVFLEKVVIKGKTLTFHYDLEGTKFTTETEFKLNSKATPKTIDFSPTDKDNPNLGKAYLGLYEMKDGQLKICYRGPESTRPKDFDDRSAGNAKTVFIVLKPKPA